MKRSKYVVCQGVYINFQYIVIFFLPNISISIGPKNPIPVRKYFLVPQASNAPTTRLTPPVLKPALMGAQMSAKYICYLDNVGAGHRKDNYLKWKIALILVLRLVVKIGPQVFCI